MKAEKTAIRILSVSALLLALAIVFLPRPTTAQVVANEGDFMVATFPATVGGGDALYVADARAGMLAVFIYDPAVRGLQVAAVRRLDEAFMMR